jgi:hypothetical protein
VNGVLRGFALVVAATTFVVSATPANAEEAEVVAVRLRYLAPLGCSDQASVLSEIVGRSLRVRKAMPDELAFCFDMRLVTQPDGRVRGELRGTSLARASVFMQSEGSCEDVVAALAYAAAFTLDPTAAREVPAETLPENPYWRWLASFPAEPAPEAEVLPDNPYWSRLGFRPRPIAVDDEVVPHNPYR